VARGRISISGWQSAPPLDERKARAKQPRAKEAFVREKEYLNQRLELEEVAEFTHQPKRTKKVYRMVVVCKTIVEERGQRMLGSDSATSSTSPTTSK